MITPHSDASPADNTRVVLRRCVAYTIDVSIIAVALAMVIRVTGDVRRVPNCDQIPAGRACFAYSNEALVVNSARWSCSASPRSSWWCS